MIYFDRTPAHDDLGHEFVGCADDPDGKGVADLYVVYNTRGNLDGPVGGILLYRNYPPRLSMLLGLDVLRVGGNGPPVLKSPHNGKLMSVDMMLLDPYFGEFLGWVIANPKYDKWTKLLFDKDPS